VCARSGSYTFRVSVTWRWVACATIDFKTFVAVLHETTVACADECAGTGLRAFGVLVARVLFARVDFVAFLRFDRVLAVSGFADTCVLARSGFHTNSVGVTRVLFTRILLATAVTVALVTVLARALSFVGSELSARGMNVTRIGFARIELVTFEAIALIAWHTGADKSSGARFFTRRFRVARVLEACIDFTAFTTIGL